MSQDPSTKKLDLMKEVPQPSSTWQEPLSNKLTKLVNSAVEAKGSAVVEACSHQLAWKNRSFLQTHNIHNSLLIYIHIFDYI